MSCTRPTKQEGTCYSTTLLKAVFVKQKILCNRITPWILRMFVYDDHRWSLWYRHLSMTSHQCLESQTSPSILQYKRALFAVTQAMWSRCRQPSFFSSVFSQALKTLGQVPNQHSLLPSFFSVWQYNHSALAQWHRNLQQTSISIVYRVIIWYCYLQWDLLSVSHFSIHVLWSNPSLLTLMWLLSLGHP